LEVFSKKKKEKENENDKTVLTHPIMIISGASNLFTKALDPTPTKFHLKEFGVVNIKGMMKKVNVVMEKLPMEHW